jgi:tetratricopeptide (TPR) repeat protein
MEDKDQNMEVFVGKLAEKEKKRRRRAYLFLAVPVLVGVFLIFWTGWQADTLQTKTVELAQAQSQSLDLQVEVYQARQATEYIRQGLASYYAGNYSGAGQLYDKAIKLDSLNPVVFELKSEALLKKGEVQKASETLDKAVAIDSAQQEKQRMIIHYVPKVSDKMKAIREIERLKELKPDSQDVIRRKQKALDLKRR